jgi:hypothetical protein
MSRRSCSVLIAAGAAVAVYVLRLRPRQLTWGATEAESVGALPGDDLVPDPDLVATRAIVVQAKADDVWPWVAQMGQQRGGLYSYDLIENLVGCDMKSADRIVPEWQHVEVGDEFRLHPRVRLRVAAVEHGRSLVLCPGGPMGEAPMPYDFTWAFVVQDEAGGEARLLVRERYAYNRRWAPLVVEPLQLVSFVMTQRMLRGIRDRAGRATA